MHLLVNLPTVSPVFLHVVKLDFFSLFSGENTCNMLSWQLIPSWNEGSKYYPHMAAVGWIETQLEITSVMYKCCNHGVFKIDLFRGFIERIVTCRYY